MATRNVILASSTTTLASILIESCIDPVTTANKSGHAGTNTTNAIYVHQIARAGIFSV